MTILARESGLSVDMADVPVQSLVPEALRGCASGEEYLARLPEHDGEMAALLAEAEAAGECLRYVGERCCLGGGPGGDGGAAARR